MKNLKFDRHEVEIENITWSKDDNAFIVEYSIYNSKGDHIATETTKIEHEGNITDIYFDALETIKKLLTEVKYETKIKN